ncbi:hypothetical protein [Sulfurimonas sp.]|uniref:hypothetical protein n=1 Tax=Sulfurimonas sp. TaxID=2022749 RepID=UPI003D1248D2
MTEQEKDQRKNRSVGRPKLDDEQKREKRITVALTQDEYDYLVKMQKMLNRPTLSSTILFFMERGQEAVRDDFSRER